jgi:hypothetical protein
LKHVENELRSSHRILTVEHAAAIAQITRGLRAAIADETGGVYRQNCKLKPASKKSDRLIILSNERFKPYVLINYIKRKRHIYTYL